MSTSAGADTNGALAELALGLTEAESLTLAGYETESWAEASGGTSIRTTGSGTASGVFNGPAGDYDLAVDWSNENDGAARYRVLVDGVEVDSWGTNASGAGGAGDIETRTIAVSLNEGSRISIEGVRETGAFARLDRIAIAERDAPPPPPPEEPAPGDAAAIGLGATEAEALTLDGYEAESWGEASGGASIRTTGSGSASGVFSGPAGAYDLAVDWSNENDGAATYRVLVDGVEVDSWGTNASGGGGAGDIETRTIAVSLQDGSRITIEGVRDSGAFARLDRITLAERDAPPPPPPEEPPPGDAVAIGLGATEAEALTLDGYAVEGRAEASGGQNIRTDGVGAASGVFSGPAGDYDLAVDWFNEGDGVARFRLLVDGAEVDAWTGAGGSGGAGVLETRTIVLTLAEGSTITLEGVRDAGEYARIDKITLAERGSPPPPVEPPPGGAAAIGLGATEAEALSLDGYEAETWAEASGGTSIRTTNTGSASGVFTGPAGDYDIAVDWSNENDGAARYRLLVDGLEIDAWGTNANGAGGAGDIETRTIAVSLQEGSQITIEGVRESGAFARLDRIALTERDAPAPPPPTPTGEIALGRTEAEDLDLDGYRSEAVADASGGAVARTDTSGTVSGVWAGAAGTYELAVVALDERDGVARYTLSVNGEEVDAWSGDSDDGVFDRREVTVDLAPDDVITIVGTRESGELARIDYVEVETPIAPVPNDLPDSAYDLFAFAGQSNAERHFYRDPDDRSAGDLGADVFEAALSARLGGPVEAIEAARGGSGSNPLADERSYWWDIAADKPGPALLDAARIIDAALASGRDLDGIVWSQGEDDARAIAADGSNADEIVEALTTATTSAFAWLRDRYGADLPNFIQEIGPFPETGPWLDGPVGAIELIRQAQADVAAADPLTTIAATTDGVAQNPDGIHFTVEGYGDIAEELADSIADQLTSPDGYLVS